ncbi:MAG TPA: hypothetical protein VIL04_03980 [Solirubrobacterales bacterium]|jgi:hypothetical protein
MSPALLQTGATVRVRASCAGAARRDPHRLFDPDRPTLEEVVNRAWEDLVDTGSARCIVCGGEMLVSGCESCGSQLT